MTAYYNEFDPFAAAWIRELIKEGLIADGHVDERSVAEVHPSDLTGFRQVHFFAGIGGWSYALRLAGITDDEPIWTGSCPCQPFSTAGKQKGVADERHLWPEMFRLISQCRPRVVYMEQVPGAIKAGWLDSVTGDLQRSGYGWTWAVLSARACGAHHQRKRLYIRADASSEGWEGYKHEQCFFIAKNAQLAVNCDSFAQFRMAVESGAGSLLPSNGVSIALARRSIKGFGNAICPQTAAAFIQAFYEAREE